MDQHFRKKRGRPKKNERDGFYSHPLAVNPHYFSSSNSNKYQMVSDLPELNNDEDSDSDFKILRMKPSSQSRPLNPSDNASQQNPSNPTLSSKTISLSLPSIDVYKALSEIVQHLQQNESTLQIVTNLVYTSTQELKDRKIIIEKKKKQLMGSNLTQEDYVRVQKEIQQQEVNDQLDIKMKIYHQLQGLNIKHFENIEYIKMQLITKYKQNRNIPLNDHTWEYVFDQKQIDQRDQHQMELIDKLIKESSLNNLRKEQIQQLSQKNNVPRDLDDKIDLKSKYEFRQVQKVFFNQTSEEGEISNNLNQYIENKIGQVIQDWPQLISLKESEILEIDQIDYGIIQDLRPDFLYTNEAFQKQQIEKYKRLIYKVYSSNDFDIQTCSDQTINDMIQICIYVLNHAHYFKKSNIDIGNINPLDALYLLSKFKL